MTTLNDGSTYCDKCEGDLTPANIVNAVFVNAMTDDGKATQLHYCIRRDAEAGTKACAPATVTSKTNLKAWQERNPDKVFRLFDEDRDAPDGSVGNGA